MLNENTVAKILEYGLQQGADFTEVFVEDSVASSINLLAVSNTNLTLPTNREV